MTYGFSIRLQRARRAAGYANAEQGARAAGQKSSRYWLHENGTEARLDTITRYARTFGVSECWLAFGNVQRCEICKAVQPRKRR